MTLLVATYTPQLDVKVHALTFTDPISFFIYIIYIISTPSLG
jgi:hypothetical protein